jgi:hypothetical protein
MQGMDGKDNSESDSKSGRAPINVSKCLNGKIRCNDESPNSPSSRMQKAKDKSGSYDLRPDR